MSERIGYLYRVLVTSSLPCEPFELILHVPASGRDGTCTAVSRGWWHVIDRWSARDYFSALKTET